MADRTGQQLGNYRLIRLLGQGDFADTYLGEHLYLKTFAAIKVLQTQLARSDQEAFYNESSTIARLKHPNIVRVLEFGVDASTNSPYLVMEHAPNGTLRQRHRRGLPVPVSTIIPYVKQIAAALQYAHDQKVVHRDVKPENMLIGANNEVLLSDFGIAIIAQRARAPDPQSVVGTVTYTAPEQIQGMPRPATDQYALAIAVYEWLTGVVPFSGTYAEVAIQQERVAPPPLREKEKSIPPDVEQVVLTALSKDPQRRFGSVQAFANALESASKGAQPQPAPRRIEDPGLYPKTMVASANPPTVPVAPGEQIPQTGYGMEPPYPAQPTPPRIPNPYTPQATPPNPYAPQQTPPAIPNPYTPLPPVPGQQGPYNPQFTPPRQTNPPPPPPGPQAPYTAQQTAPQAPFLPQPPDGSPKPRRALSPVITVLLIVLAVLLIGGGGGLIYYTTIFQPNQRYAQATATSVARTEGTAHVNATSTGQVVATATAQTNATATAFAQATANVQATATALQNIYTQATSGTPTISDPLSQPDNNGWDDFAGSCTFTGGAYHAMVSGRFYDPCLASATNFSNLALQVQMTIIRGPTGGIIFRSDSGGNNFYVFRINTDGTYSLQKYTQTSSQLSSPSTLTNGMSPAINQGLNQTNLMAVVAQGSNIYLYVNKQYVDMVSDSSYKSGEIGVYTISESGTSDAAFSNLQVWRL